MRHLYLPIRCRRTILRYYYTPRYNVTLSPISLYSHPRHLIRSYYYRRPMRVYSALYVYRIAFAYSIY